MTVSNSTTMLVSVFLFLVCTFLTKHSSEGACTKYTDLFLSVPNRALRGHNIKIIPFRCKKCCIKECVDEGQSCISIDYGDDTDDKRCVLGSESAATKPDDMFSTPNYTYIHRLCERCSRLSTNFLSISNRYISQSNIGFANNVSPQKCQELCVAKGQRCKSADFHWTGRCYLNKRSAATHPTRLKTSTRFIYLHRLCERGPITREVRQQTGTLSAAP